MSNRLAYGIPSQTGAQAFKREIAQSLLQWRELIARDEARVVRSLHVPGIPGADGQGGSTPVAIYQLALRASGKVVTVTIQGKHDPLPNPAVSSATTSAAGVRRRGGASSGKAAAAAKARCVSDSRVNAKRRLHDIQEEETCGVSSLQDSPFQEEEEGQYDDDQQAGDYDQGAYEDQQDCDTEELIRRKRARTPYIGSAVEGSRNASEAPSLADESMRTAIVHLHPPTPHKEPSHPSSRPPAPLRYSVRARSRGTDVSEALYGANDLRESTYTASVHYPPSSHAGSVIGNNELDFATQWDEEASISGETERTEMSGTNVMRPLRRSSRLASLPPGHSHQDEEQERQVALTAQRLREVELAHQGEPLMHHPYHHQHQGSGETEDVDMSSTLLIDYADPEEARLAREYEERERQRAAYGVVEDEDMSMACDSRDHAGWTIKQERLAEALG